MSSRLVGGSITVVSTCPCQDINPFCRCISICIWAPSHTCSTWTFAKAHDQTPPDDLNLIFWEAMNA
jgi:hypothetical protein